MKNGCVVRVEAGAAAIYFNGKLQMHAYSQADFRLKMKDAGWLWCYEAEDEDELFELWN